MQVQGTIYKIGETETFPSGFTKRLLVVESEGEYPQKIPMEFVKEKTSILDNYKVGDKVTVDINLRGNEYQEKFYLSAQGWKIEKSEGSNTAEPTKNANDYKATPSQAFGKGNDVFAEETDELDDLGF
jgi:single-strand DNA-binding protein